MKLFGNLAFKILGTLAVSTPLVAIDVSYTNDIKPIIQRACSGCHQPATKMGGLILTEYDGIMTGGQNGPILMAGAPEKSRLIGMLSGDVKPMMPMGGEPLPEAEIAILKRWVAQGAKVDTLEPERGPQVPVEPPTYKQPPAVGGLTYSPDGTLLVVGGYKEIVVHRSDGSKIVARLLGKSERITGLAFTPDGKTLVAVGGTPAQFGEVQIWDIATKIQTHSIVSTADTLFGGAVSPDGKFVCAGGADKSVRIFEIATGKETLKAGHHEDWVLGTAYGIDGKRVVTIGRDRAAKLTNAETGAFLENINLLRDQLYAIERHPRRDYVLVGGLDRVPYLYMMDRPRALKIADDSTLVREFEEQKAKIFSLAFSPDGSYIAVGGMSDEVPIYETGTGKRTTTLGVTEGVFAIEFHPKGDQITVAGYDGRIRIFDPKTGKLLNDFSPVPLRSKVASN
jgi:DNA-binding beta-propeller fold protein YncE